MPDGFYRCRFCGEEIELDRDPYRKHWDRIYCSKCGKFSMYPRADRERLRLRKDDLHGV